MNMENSWNTLCTMRLTFKSNGARTMRLIFKSNGALPPPPPPMDSYGNCDQM